MSIKNDTSTKSKHPEIHKIISIQELEFLASKADEYCFREDIEREVYQSLHDEQEAYWKFLQENPDCYGNKKDWDQANIHNLFIRYALMLRLGQFR